MDFPTVTTENGNEVDISSLWKPIPISTTDSYVGYYADVDGDYHHWWYKDGTLMMPDYANATSGVCRLCHFCSMTYCIIKSRHGEL